MRCTRAFSLFPFSYFLESSLRSSTIRNSFWTPRIHYRLTAFSENSFRAWVSVTILRYKRWFSNPLLCLLIDPRTLVYSNTAITFWLFFSLRPSLFSLRALPHSCVASLFRWAFLLFVESVPNSVILFVESVILFVNSVTTIFVFSTCTSLENLVSTACFYFRIMTLEFS